MKMNLKSNKILTTKDEIMDFMKVKDAVLDLFVKNGLPVTKMGRNWYAHTENLEEWLKNMTKKQKIIESQENNKK